MSRLKRKANWTPVWVTYSEGNILWYACPNFLEKKQEETIQKTAQKLLAYSFLDAEPAPMREKKSDLLILYS